MFNTVHRRDPILTVRPYNRALDYDILKTWWKQHNLLPVPRSFLPPMGYVVEADGEPTCAGFVCQILGTPVGHVESLIANKETDSNTRSESLDFLITVIKERAELAGTTVLCGFTKIPGVMKRIKPLGFKQVDANLAHFIWSNH